MQNPIEPTAWCSAEQLDKIHDASMRILENVGIDFMDEEALDAWEKAGAKVDRSSQHVWLDRGLLMELVEKHRLNLLGMREIELVI